jgi:hypothetical protein
MDNPSEPRAGAARRTAATNGGRADPVVPAYALTKGRTRAATELPLEAVVVATGAGDDAPLSIEERAILAACEHGPASVAELGATLGVPAGVARVLVGDLAGRGLLELHQLDGDGPGAAVLGRLLDGLRQR